MANMSGRPERRFILTALTLAMASLSLSFIAVADGSSADQSIGTAPSVLSWREEGQAIWVQGPDGKLKVRAYPSAQLSEHPVLVLWIHGDLDPGAEPYELAQRIAHVATNVVLVALLRPGYSDADGDSSAGLKGYAAGDNYTAEVVDDVHAVIQELKTRFHARAVVVLGHSGGAGITGDLLGRHPEDADAAVLIACSCDPKGLMARLMVEHPHDAPSGLPNFSLTPLDLAGGVSLRTHVRKVIGSNDTVVLVPPSQAYARALQARGVDIRLTVVPNAGHVDVLQTEAVRQEVAEVIGLEGGRSAFQTNESVSRCPHKAA
jgi:pimeloyl-ACP methyl ester carboxylesterase